MKKANNPFNVQRPFDDDYPGSRGSNLTPISERHYPQEVVVEVEEHEEDEFQQDKNLEEYKMHIQGETIEKSKTVKDRGLDKNKIDIAPL
jgi:hypothetical protein